MSVIFAESPLKELAEAIGGAENVLIVHGKGSYVSCGAKALIDSLKKERGSCRFTEFADFRVNPDEADLRAALPTIIAGKPQAIIAIGGGSVIDMAKLIRHELEWHPLLIAVPTTAGTGAEATHFAVMYRNGVKHSIAAPDMAPDVAILAPELTYGAGPYLTACAGFDALAQAIESFWSRKATEESADFARKAIELIWPMLPECVASPTPASRAALAKGAYYAGRAINISTTTAPHAFSYPFTVHYGIPHGHAVALTFSCIAAINMAHWDNEPKKTELARMLGVDSPEMVADKLGAYISSLGLKGLDEIEYSPDIIVSNINAQRLSNNPVDFTAEDIASVVRCRG